MIGESDLIDLSQQAGAGGYYRAGNCGTPHNLFNNTDTLWEQTPPEAGRPTPLFAYLNPISGGPEGGGWPFGRPVTAGELNATLQRVRGCELVEDLRIFGADPVTGQRGQATQRLELEHLRGHVAHGLRDALLLPPPRQPAELTQLRLGLLPADVLLHEVDARRGDVEEHAVAELEDEVLFLGRGEGRGARGEIAVFQLDLFTYPLPLAPHPFVQKTHPAEARDAVRDVVDYVRSLSPAGTATGSAAAAGAPHDTGRSIFAEQCAACHGENAKGRIEAGAPDLTDDFWLYGGDAQSIYASVYGGRQGQMPSWERRLAPIERKILTLYLLDLGAERK